MSFFTRIFDVFRPQLRASLANPAEWMYSWFGGKPTNSGVNINADSALTHATVFACIRVLAETFASLPVGFYRETSKGSERITTDGRDFLISKEPSDLLHSYDFRLTAMAHLCLDGNAYAVIERNGSRRPVALHLCQNPGAVVIERDKRNPSKLWYKLPEYKDPFPASDILHIKGLSRDGIYGKSPISLFAENIGLGLATVQTQGSLWKNGTLISGYLKHPGKLDPDQSARLRDTWKARHAGKDNAGSTPVLENGLEFVPLTLKPADAMFLETARLSRQDICAIYRVAPHMVGDLERSTNNNIEHQSLEFARYTMLPYLKSWEAELDRKLLFDSEKGRAFFRFIMEGLLRGDTKSRAEYYTRALGSVSTPGWMSKNEVRALENLPSVEDGDTIYSPLLNQ